jgi:hypothetical protein
MNLHTMTSGLEWHTVVRPDVLLSDVHRQKCPRELETPGARPQGGKSL